MLQTRHEKKENIFRFILFLGVLPFDTAAFTLFKNPEIGEYISLFLNALTTLIAFIYLYNSFCYSKYNPKTALHKLGEKYCLFGIFTLVLYIIGSLFVSEFMSRRIFSVCCVFFYYLFCIFYYNGDIHSMIRDLHRALFVLIFLSFVLYLMGDANVDYIENASLTSFKGIAKNRNSYTELTLIFLATNYYLYFERKKWPLYYIITSLVAVYTTFLTRGATSIICLTLFIILLVLIRGDRLKEFLSFRMFLFIYSVVFVFMVIYQSSTFGIDEFLSEFFEKKQTLTGRTDIWKTAFEAISKNFFLGYGFDSYVMSDMGVSENEPHNGILYIVLTQGIVGLFGFAVMVSSVVKKCHRIMLKNNAFAAMGAFLITWAVKGLVESVFSYSHFVFWFSLIIIEILVLRMKASEVEEIESLQV